MTWEEAAILAAVKHYSQCKGANLMDLMVHISRSNIEMSWVQLYRILLKLRERGLVSCHFDYLSLPNKVKPHIKPAMVLKRRVYTA
jgi:hypothetical protein